MNNGQACDHDPNHDPNHDLDPDGAAPAADWLDAVLARASAAPAHDGEPAFTAAVMRRVAAESPPLRASLALAQVQRRRDHEMRQGRWNLAGGAVGAALALWITQLAEFSTGAALPGLPAWATLPIALLLGGVVLSCLLVMERRG